MSLLGPRKAGRGRGGVSHHPLLIRTKLEPPAQAERILPRERLFEFLDEQPAWKFVAVHAPAGFGKSEFLRELKLRLESRHWGVGWVRLDREDHDPSRLLRYLEAALQQSGIIAVADADQAASGFGSEPAALQLERLCSLISTIDQPAALIIDHAHELQSEEAWHCLETMLRYVPEQFRVCIASRAPDFPGLGRLRGEAGLVEISAEQLAFTAAETQQFVAESEALRPWAASGPRLQATCQGWPLGLQMLAIHLDACEDPQAEFIEASGADGPFPDYFRQEVFDRLSAKQRRLVLLIGVVGAAPVDLVTELRGTPVLPAEIEELISAGMFLSRDARPGWYRMHPMLARFTEVEWKEQDPDGLVQCHEQAALWFGSRSEVQSAVQHAVLAGNAALALGFINQCLEACIDQGRFAQIASWRGIFPENDLHRYPVLVLMMAWELGGQGRWLDAEVLANGVIEALTRKGRRKRQDTRENEVRRAIGLRACAGLISGQDLLLEESSSQWRKSDDGKPGETGLAMAALAEACLQNGDQELLQARLQRASALQGQHASGLAGALTDWVRARASLEAGDLERAIRLARMSASLVETAEVRDRTSGLLDLVAAMVDFERGQTEGSLESLQHLVQDPATLVPAMARSEAAILLAKQLFARQGLAPAREALQSARERLADLHGSLCRVRLDAEDCRLLIRSGQKADAKQLLRKLGWEQLSRSRGTGYDPIYAEIAEITARLALAEGEVDGCLKLLGELQVMTPDWMAYRKARHLALEITASHASDREDAAISMLRALLAEAAKVGLVQVFLEEGEAMGKLLGSLFPNSQVNTMEQGIYINRLLKAFQALSASRNTPSVTQHPAVESLTEREAEVLQMVADGCSNREISTQLYLSLGTVKWHLHNVYDKLMVRNRTQAVNRARELKWM